jgi:hypothetical protein
MKPRGLVQLTAAVVLAAPVFAESPRPPDSYTSVYAGVEVANSDSRRFILGTTAQIREVWSVNAAVARADFELPEATTQSTLAAAQVSYDFGAFGAGAGFRRSDIEEVSESRDWLATAFFEHEELRLGLEIVHRESTLEPSDFTEDLGAGIGIVSGISRCSVDALGYRGSLDLDRPTWSGFASLRIFDYDDFDCALEITAGGGPPGNGPPPHARGRALGRRLAAASLDPAVGAVSRLVPREASLLESSAEIGFKMPVSQNWIGGVELFRDVEKLDGSEYLTGIVSAATRLGDTWTLELSLGYSAADVIDDSAFAGVRVTAAL